jgi:hypothetical protein
VLALITACHLPTLGFGFLDWDDDLHVTRNPLVVGPPTASLTERWTTPALGYPIPVTIATYTLQARVFGLLPWHFHAVNVAVHVANCALVFALSLRLRLGRVGASCAALLFGLHPVVAEPVSWVSGRKDLLAVCFGLGAVYLAWPPSSSRRRLTSLAAFVLGLLSKPSVATLGVIIALCRDWFSDPSESGATLRTRADRALRVAAPYLCVVAPIAVLGTIGQRAAGALVERDGAGAGFARAIWFALAHHLRLLLGMEEPTVKYTPSPWPPRFDPAVDLVPLAALGLVMLLGRLPQPQRRAAQFGAVWMGLTYLPNSNLLPIARFLADSYVYLPLIGASFCLGAVADACEQARPAWRTWLRWVLPAVVFGACVPAFAHSQARFSDDAALWAHARRRFPQNRRICRQWANGVVKMQGALKGLRATDTCIEQFGDQLFARNRALLLDRLGRVSEARQWLKRAERKH